MISVNPAGRHGSAKSSSRAFFTALTVLALAAGACLIGCPLQAQVKTLAPAVVPGAKPVQIERIQVHSTAIEGNLERNSADRDVIIVLPPSYKTSLRRRYPVVYALHGYSIDPSQWIQEIHVPQSVEGAFAKNVPEMIIVLPSSKTAHGGSFYSSSVTTGDFEAFITRDLISYVDAHYRTIARPQSRGLVGHSMGGYGAARIGIKHADLFGALYLMSPCCLSPLGSRGLTAAKVAQLEALPSAAAGSSLAFGPRGTLALAAAWSPNPRKAPLFLDLPVDREGKERADILGKWTANAPLAFLDQYVSKVRRYAGIAMDVGDRDSLKDDTRKLHDALLFQGVANELEIYEGDHSDHVAIRFQEHVLPFFGRLLASPSIPSRR